MKDFNIEMNFDESQRENLVKRIKQEVMQRLKNGNTFTQENTSGYPGEDVAHAIEHSVMNPDTTEEQVRNACMDARKYRFANVCVFPYFVPLAASLLKDSGINVCTAIAFPHGVLPTEMKIIEAKDAINNGAHELDIAVNISVIKSGKFEEARNDLESVINVCRGKAIVKAIYDQGIYSEEEKIKVLNIAVQSGADFIKIQNFLTGKKAVPEDVSFVRSKVGKAIGIKIDGGVSDAGTLRKLLEAGANRVGCSKSVKIVRGE